jgi:hypothetical protein
MAGRGPFLLGVPSHCFRFELHDIGGPYVLGKHGHPLAYQPGPGSLFWEAYWQWDRQGRHVDDQGRCIFNWETALVQITTQGSRTTTPPTPRARPNPTAKVTIRSTPQDAKLFADGEFVGNAPAIVTLSVGKHQFRAVRRGYEEWSKEVELIPDSELTFVAKLVKTNRKP